MDWAFEDWSKRQEQWARNQDVWRAWAFKQQQALSAVVPLMQRCEYCGRRKEHHVSCRGCGAPN